VPFTVGQCTAVTSVSLAANLPSPQSPNTPIVWTAAATGGTAPQFRFWVQAPNGSFTLGQDYGPSNTFAWTTPAVQGNYNVFVWARSSCSSADKEADRGVPFTVGQCTAVTSVSLAANLPSPQPVGTTIAFTAVATGGSAPQFQFWSQRVGGPFVLEQPYGPSPTLTGTLAVAGDFLVIVWARSSCSSAVFEADRAVAFQVTSAGPQVRFLNALIRSTGQSFTAELRAAQGNVWFSFSLVPSPYQATARTLGPFEFRDGGVLVATTSGTVNLPTTGPQFFTIVLTLQNNQFALGLLQDTAPAAEVRDVDVSAAVFLQTLQGSEPVPRTEEYELRRR
jgi:hypothetical protein